MATYAIGDIHGCYDEWMELNNRILKEDPDARFILLGDIIDRGPKSLEMIRWMMKNVDNTKEDSRYRMVIGNHEFEKIDWWRKARREWTKGLRPYDRYDFHRVLESLSVYEVDDIIGAFNRLPYEIQETVNGTRFVICHGDVLVRPNLEPMKKSDLTNYEKFFIVWERVYGPVLEDVQVINGHTPTVLLWEEGVPGVPGVCYHNGNRHIVDCGMVYEKYYQDSNLCALRLDDMEEIYLFEDRALAARKKAEDSKNLPDFFEVDEEEPFVDK